jgi:hypothetical protein
MTTDPPPSTKREAAPKPSPDTPPVTSATELSIFTPDLLSAAKLPPGPWSLC